MAKHWLAQCHYYGYGLRVNRQKGLELLRANPIGNSEVLLAQWEYEMHSQEVISQNAPSRLNTSVLRMAANPEGITQVNSDILPHDVLGRWLGEWQIMDWSGQKVMRTIPMEIRISETVNRMLDATIVLDGNEFDGSIIQNKNELIFPNMSVTLRKKYTDHPDELTLDYRMTSLTFKASGTDREGYITGELETYIENWSEPGPPGRLLLQREAAVLNRDIPDAPVEQDEHFIKVYPNPFEEDLLLHYTLEQDSDVSVRLLDYYHPSKILRVEKRKQKKGERMISFDGLNALKSGLYIIYMTVGEENHTRIVIKK